MKLTFTCSHCEKENELLIQTISYAKQFSKMIENINPEVKLKKAKQVFFYDTNDQRWKITVERYYSINEFYKIYTERIHTRAKFFENDNET